MIEPPHIHILLITTMFLLLILIITNFFPHHSHSQPNYNSIRREKFYNYGDKIQNISYHVWGQNSPSPCGGGGDDEFNLHCSNNIDQTTTISIGTHNFKVLDINTTTSTIKMKRTDRVCEVSPDFQDRYIRHMQVHTEYSLESRNEYGELIASSSRHCSDHKKSTPWIWKRKIVLGILSGATILFMGIMMCCFSCKISTRPINLWFMANNHDQVIEAFLESHRALSQKRYRFSEVKRMTNSFKTKLGQGGFGVVYKGKLPNNFPIAVKILKASKGDGEEFMNEVASISKTSHVNVVTLLGFCFEGRKKALIYEFMPNGSLDNFICNKGPQNIVSLSWEKLFQIAKGIARGLEYLHKGCNARILHFDIKPHNILLDENFCPKISDFGLAKVCPQKESIISMSILRGTMGYIAPELWNRRFGGVSHKSDVYSYGMMLLEMVGVRSNTNSEGDQTSEYFPDWIYKKLESGGDLRHDGVIDTEENEIARGMTIVGLWCIQMFPNDRPPMGKVVEMLETNMNSLDIPPKPMISSPIKSIPESSTS